MKKVLFSLFAVVLLAATMVSCGTDPLQQEVDEFKKQLPMDMGMGMLCTDVAIVGDYLTYSATIDEEYYGENIIDLFTENVDELKAAMLEDDDDPDVEELAKLCKDSKKGLSYNFVGSNTGKKLTVNIEYDEL